MPAAQEGSWDATIHRLQMCMAPLGPCACSPGRFPPDGFRAEPDTLQQSPLPAATASRCAPDRGVCTVSAAGRGPPLACTHGSGCLKLGLQQDALRRLHSCRARTRVGCQRREGLRLGCAPGAGQGCDEALYKLIGAARDVPAMQQRRPVAQLESKDPLLVRAARQFARQGARGALPGRLSSWSS